MKQLNDSRPGHNATTTAIANESAVFAGKETEIVLWSVITGGASFLGAFLNLLALIAAWPTRSRNSSFSFLLCHFIAVNLFMCLFDVPVNVFMVLAKMQNHWIPVTVCHYVQFIWGMSLSVINWADAGLAFNRCIALFAPHHYVAWTTRVSNISVIAIGWLASLAGVLAPSLSAGFSAVMRLHPFGFCVWIPGPAGQLGMFSIMIMGVVPYVISGVGALLIIWKSHQLLNGSSIRPMGAEPSRGLRYRIKMARMLLLTFLWTAVCTIVGYINVYGLATVAQQHPLVPLWFRAVTPFQYGFTPCILLLSNEEYRKRLGSIIRITNNVTPRPMASSLGKSNTVSGPQVQQQKFDC